MESPALISNARKYLYVRETAPNDGPEVRIFLAFVGCEPGCSWCAAFVCYLVHETDPSFQWHKSASALSLLEKNPTFITHDPQPGDIVVWCHDAAKHLGHVAILTGVVRVNGKVVSITAIAGNTSADGKSANGDRVAEHDVPLEKIAGYLRVCSE